MTRQQALNAMRSGNKVTHISYGPGEYIYLKNGLILDEKNDVVTTEFNYLNSTHQINNKWLSGWKIYNK